MGYFMLLIEVENTAWDEAGGGYTDTVHIY